MNNRDFITGANNASAQKPRSLFGGVARLDPNLDFYDTWHAVQIRLDQSRAVVSSLLIDDFFKCPSIDQLSLLIWLVDQRLEETKMMLDKLWDIHNRDKSKGV